MHSVAHIHTYTLKAFSLIGLKVRTCALEVDVCRRKYELLLSRERKKSKGQPFFLSYSFQCPVNICTGMSHDLENGYIAKGMGINLCQGC